MSDSEEKLNTCQLELDFFAPPPAAPAAAETEKLPVAAEEQAEVLPPQPTEVPAEPEINLALEPDFATTLLTPDAPEPVEPEVAEAVFTPDVAEPAPELETTPDLEVAPFEDVSAEAAEPVAPKPFTYRECCRGALAFLCSLHPDALASGVSTRRQTLKVAAAGCWRATGKPGIAQTIIVAAGRDLGSAIERVPETTDLVERIHALAALKLEKEAEIRQNEPHLAAADDLFDEFRTWDYRHSADRSYHKVVRELEALQRRLRRGSRLELFRRAGVADYCYVALSAEQYVHGFPLPEWGVLLIERNGDFKIEREAPLQDNVTPGGRKKLAVNIAVASRADVLFAAGLESAERDHVVYRQVPHKRRKLREN